MLVATYHVVVRWKLEMDIKSGDVAIFKNGEEAAVVCITRSGQDYFRICFSNAVSGWVGEEIKSLCWTYTEKGVFNTDFPNGNDIVKVIPC